MKKYLFIPLILAMVFILCLSGCSLFGNNEDPPEPVPATDIMLSSDNLVFLPDTPEEGIIFSVSLSEGYEDESLDYTLSWANFSSEWSYNKDVNDYIFLNRVSSEGNIFIVRCLNPNGFKDKIIITVSLLNFPDIKSECKIDFRQRFSNHIYFLTGNSAVLEKPYILNFNDNVNYLFNVVSFVTDGTIPLGTEIKSVKARFNIKVWYALMSSFGLANIPPSVNVPSSSFKMDGIIRSLCNAYGVPLSDFVNNADFIGTLALMASSTDSPVIEFEITVSYGGTVYVNEVIDIYAFIPEA